jgi:hypothetical protein
MKETQSKVYLSISAILLLTVIYLQNIPLIIGNIQKAKTQNRNSKKSKRYINKDYGFSVIIPMELPVSKSSPDGLVSDHGVVIHLDENSFIELNGSVFNSVDWESLDDAIEAENNNIGEFEHGTNINILKREQHLLGQLKALRVVIKYETPDIKEPLIKEIIAARRTYKYKDNNKDDFYYTAILLSREKDFEKYHSNFATIVNSWAFIAISE